jgi:predicted outer membrane repeat protein
MSWTLLSLLCGFRRRARGRRSAPGRPPRFRPRLEELEGRWALSTLTVTSPADSGPGSLRATITGANSGDSIVFDPNVFAGQTTITLTSDLTILTDLTITGPGAGLLTLSGGHASKVFEVVGGTVTISGLTVADGLGGGIDNGGDLTLRDCVVRDNAAQYGGGIYNSRGTLTLIDCSVLDNKATYDGGGLAVDSGTAVLLNGEMAGNQAGLDGGGIAVLQGGAASLSNVTVFDNHTNDPQGNGLGGGIYNLHSLMIFNGTAVDSNGADKGGGVYNEAADLLMGDCTVTGNTAVLGAGLYNAAHNEHGRVASLGTVTFRENVASESGGGLYNTGSLVADGGTKFINNGAAQDGGGIFNLLGTFTVPGTSNDAIDTLTLCDAEVFDNGAGGRGGGLFNTGFLTFNHGEIRANTASNGGGAFGGSGFLDLNDTRVLSNIAFTDGGGVYSQADASLTDTTLFNNYAGGGGGGLLVQPAGSFMPHVRLDFCSVTYNRAGDGGGIALAGSWLGAPEGFALTVWRSTMAYNQALRGGGLFIGNQAAGLPAAVVESTIALNSAALGGGVYNTSATLWLLDCTVSGNLAYALLGGGLYTIPDDANNGAIGDTVLKNTIVAGNQAPLFGFFLESDIAGPIDSLGHNLFGERVPNDSFVRLGAPDPTDLLNVDARLGPLQDNGGPTQTMALLEGSPAVGAGTVQSDPITGGVPGADQRGAPVVSFTDIEGNVVTLKDIGAFGASNGPVPTHTPAGGTCGGGVTPVDTGGVTPASFPPAGAGTTLAPLGLDNQLSGLGGIADPFGAAAFQGGDVSSLVPTARDEVWLVPLPSPGGAAGQSGPFAPASRPSRFELF